jgi:hypothetical protein
MAIIYSYPEKTTPAGGDFLVITDSQQPYPNKNRTKSLTITGGGTLNTIAMFTPDGQTIGDSIITYDNTFLPVITVGGRLVTNGDLIVTGRGSFSGDYVRFDCPIEVKEELTDNLGLSGTAGQVLSSTGTGVEWISGGGGTVTGTGTTNTLPVWTDGPNGVLGDSKVYQDNSNIYMLAGSPSGAKCDYSFGIETFSGQKQGTTNGFEFKTGGHFINQAVLDLKIN